MINVYKLYFLTLLNNALLVSFIMLPILKQFNLGSSDLYMMGLISALTRMVLEIPTGYLSDKYGRKRMLVTGTVFAILGSSSIYFSQYQYSFYLYSFLLGISSACSSGAEGALLQKFVKIDEYEKIFSRFIAFGRSGRLCAALVASLIMSSISVEGLLFIQVLICIVALAVAISLPQGGADENQRAVKGLRHALTQIYKSPFDLYTILTLAFVAGNGVLFITYVPAMLLDVGLSTIEYGWAKTAINLATTSALMFSIYITRHFSDGVKGVVGTSIIASILLYSLSSETLLFAISLSVLLPVLSFYEQGKYFKTLSDTYRSTYESAFFFLYMLITFSVNFCAVQLESYFSANISLVVSYCALVPITIFLNFKRHKYNVDTR